MNNTKKPGLMKTLFSLSIALLFLSMASLAQQSTLPSAEIYTCDGFPIQSETIIQNNQATVVVFWKTYDESCIKHISAMIDSREEVTQSDSLDLIIICIDCIGRTNHIKPFVMGQGWDAKVYIDKNGDLKRKMGVVETPLTLMYDSSQELVCQYTGYCAGTDELICDKLRKCLAEN